MRNTATLARPPRYPRLPFRFTQRLRRHTHERGHGAGGQHQTDAAMIASLKYRQKKWPPPRKKRCMNDRRSSSLASTSSTPPNTNALDTSDTPATAAVADASRLSPLTLPPLVKSRKTPRPKRFSTDAASGEYPSTAFHHVQAGSVGSATASRTTTK